MDINPLSRDEIKKWKKGNINVIVSTRDETKYFNPGGGVTLSGDNIQNVRICYHIISYIENVEEFLKEKVDDLIKFIKSYGKEIKPPLEFQLISFEFIGLNLKLEVIEKNSQVYLIFEENKKVQLLFKE